MSRWLRLVPVVLLGSTGVAYVLARPELAQRVPHLAIWEFPVGALVVTLLLWASLATRRPPTPIIPWRRHEQVVRPLADPALASDIAALERWVETGEGPAVAADVLSRARTTDRQERERLRAEITELLSTKGSRRKRESLLKSEFQGA